MSVGFVCSGVADPKVTDVEWAERQHTTQVVALNLTNNALVPVSPQGWQVRRLYCGPPQKDSGVRVTLGPRSQIEAVRFQQSKLELS